jgi:integrase
MAKAFDKTQVKQIRKLLADRKSGLRDLALFNTGISTMLRTSDLLNLKVSDVIDEFGDLKKKFSVRMKKTDRPVTVLLDEDSQRSLFDWIEASGKNRSDFIFTGLTTRTSSTPITSAHHRLLVKEWCGSVGIGTEGRSTHSLRKTRASIAYKQTGNLEVVRQALGHTNLRNTATYLDIDNEEMVAVMEKVRV